MTLVLAEALPDNGGYVAAAFLVFLVLLLVYFAIMAARLARVERELVELAQAPPPGGEPGEERAS